MIDDSQLQFSKFFSIILRWFDIHMEHGLLGSTSMSTSLLLSPLWISLCKRKSTRLAAIFGGLVASLGFLFTSFASQFHQLFFSYGLFLGVGVGLSRDASAVMIGQYFKRKRDLVEIFIVAGSGVGIVLMTVAMHSGISSLKWRLGLQAVTGSILVSFFLGICYRSASLYHPQRRAILHLKNQRKKVKEKFKRDDKPPFFDFTCLKSKTMQILLLSTTLTSFGIHVPLIYLGWKCKELKIDDISIVILHVYLGTSWLISCFLFGLLVIQKTNDCRISKQYLCQISSICCGFSIVGLTLVKEFGGLGIFAWVYGFFIGGYNYTLKVFTYDRTNRHFPRAWSFVQFSQGFPISIGSIISGVILSLGKSNLCFYLSAAATFSGSVVLFLIQIRRRKLARQGETSESFKLGRDLMHLSKLGITFSTPLVDRLDPGDVKRREESGGCDSGDNNPSFESSLLGGKNLASISEEGLFPDEVDFQDIYFDWEDMLVDGDDAITSCDKVENCLYSEADGGDIQIVGDFTNKGGGKSKLHHSFYSRRNLPPKKGLITGIGGPAMKVLTGVIGIRPPITDRSSLSSIQKYSTGPKFNLCEIAIAESETFSASSPSSSQNLDSYPSQPHQSESSTKHPFFKSSSVQSTSSGKTTDCQSHYKKPIVESPNFMEIPSYEQLQKKKNTKSSQHSTIQESAT